VFRLELPDDAFEQSMLDADLTRSCKSPRISRMGSSLQVQQTSPIDSVPHPSPWGSPGKQTLPPRARAYLKPTEATLRASASGGG